jgi:PAS domain S-box-containing protein
MDEGMEPTNLMNFLAATEYPHLSKALDASSVPIVIVTTVDRPMTVEYANEAAEDLSGFSRHELVGMSLRDLLGCESNDLSKHRLDLSKLTRKHCCVRGACWLHRNGGDPLLCTINSSSFTEGDDSARRAILTFEVINNRIQVGVQQQANEMFEAFTARERQVFESIAQGRSTKEIARQLEISPRTAEQHRAKIYAKAKTRNIATLVLFGQALGLRIKPDFNMDDGD